MAKYQLESVTWRSVTQRGVALAHRVACRGVARQCVWHGVSWRHASFFCDMFIPTHATPAPSLTPAPAPLLLLMLLFNKVQRPSSWHYRRSNRTWCEVYLLSGGHSENIRASTWTLLWLELSYLLRESNLNSAISFHNADVQNSHIYSLFVYKRTRCEKNGLLPQYVLPYHRITLAF